MPKRHPEQYSFAAGELTPRLWRRTDTAQHSKGLSIAQNFVPLPHGSLFFRMGLNYVVPAPDAGRMYRFREEGGDVRLEFYPTNLRIEGTDFASPYAANELAELQFAQDNRGRMFVFSGNHPPYLLYRSAATWVFEQAEFAGLPEYAFDDDNSPTITTTGGPLTLTFGPGLDEGSEFILAYGSQPTTPITYSAVPSVTITRINEALANILREPDIGMNSGIRTFGNLPTLTLEFINEFEFYDISRINVQSGDLTITGGGVVISTAPEPAWSAARGYPRCGTFYGQRLLIASTVSRPRSVWGARVGAPLDLAVGPNASDPVQFEISSESPVDICWLSARGNLLIGTTGGDFALSGSITPTLDFVVNQQNSKPSARRQPVKIGSTVVYLQEGRRKLRGLSFFEATATWESVDLSFTAEHLLQTPINDMAWSENPDGVLWLTRDDGVLLSFTHSPTQNIGAWARHTTTANINSVAVIAEDDGDAILCQLERFGNQNIERIPQSNASYTTNAYVDGSITYTMTREIDAYLDSAVTVLGTATTITGLTHLENAEVSVVVDGAAHPKKTVVGGEITLDYAPTTQAIVGLPYLGIARTLPMPAQAAVHQWGQVATQLLDSYPPYINDQQEWNRNVADLMDAANALYSGEYQVSSDFIEDNQDGVAVVEVRDPFPCHIACLWGVARSGRQ